MQKDIQEQNKELGKFSNIISSKFDIYDKLFNKVFFQILLFA
jgi:hypothetical protein